MSTTTIATVHKTVVVDPVEPASPLLAVAHEARLLQHPQVLRDRRPADRQAMGELADRARAFLERLEDQPPGGVAERVEGSVSAHLR